MSQTSVAGAQTFEATSYGASGVGGNVAMAAAGQALAVSQPGTAAEAVAAIRGDS